jgi:hypothetical protein
MPKAHPPSSAPLLLYGSLILLAGLAVYLAGVFLGLIRLALPSLPVLRGASEALVWYSGIPVLLGLLLGALELFFFLPRKQRRAGVAWEPVANTKLTVLLTALNDELSIAEAVADFRAHPAVERVVVLDNDSDDGTRDAAARAGAIVVRESQRGYGHCVYRAWQEGLRHGDTELTLLCEGDRTFRAHDIDKLLAYLPHADIVNGTRIVEQLRSPDTQLTTFIYYGNFFVGKLLEAKHIGKGTFTDVGTTYKLCRNEPLARLLPALNPAVNLEFNAHFLDTALREGLRLVECPITFHPRVGKSKGGNTDNWRAFRVGLRMMRGIIFGWPKARPSAP